MFNAQQFPVQQPTQQPVIQPAVGGFSTPQQPMQPMAPAGYTAQQPMQPMAPAGYPAQQPMQQPMQPMQQPMAPAGYPAQQPMQQPMPYQQPMAPANPYGTQQGYTGSQGLGSLFSGMSAVQESTSNLGGGEYIVKILDCTMLTTRNTNQPMFRLALKVVQCIVDEKGVVYGQPGYTGHAVNEEVSWAAVRNADARYHTYFLKDIKTVLSRIYKAYLASQGRQDESVTWSDAQWNEVANSSCGRTPDGSPSNNPSPIIGFGIRVRSTAKRDDKGQIVLSSNNRPLYRTDFLEAYIPSAMTVA